MPKTTRSRLTKRAVETASATGSVYRLRDDDPKGLVLRIAASGAKSWAITWGRGQERVIGHHPVMTLEHARKQAKQLLLDPAGPAPRTKVETFGQFLDDRYGPWVKAERKAGAATLANLKAQFAEYLSKPIGAIDAWKIERFKADRLRAGLKPATVNRDLVRIRACLSKAVEWGVITEHPLRGVKRAKGADDSRTRFLSTPEEKRLRDALEKLQLRRRDHLRPIVLVAINTGLRRGELFSLTWGDVSIPRAMLTVTAASAKGQVARHVALNDEAVATLRAWKPKDAKAHELVFPGPGGGRMTNVSKSWAFLVGEAKLVDFRFHDLRHHFASRLAMAGVDLFTIKELLGHSDFAMTQRYAHLAHEHKAAAVAKLRW